MSICDSNEEMFPVKPQTVKCLTCSSELDREFLPVASSSTPLENPSSDSFAGNTNVKTMPYISSAKANVNKNLPFFAPVEDDFIVVAIENETSRSAVTTKKHIIQKNIEDKSEIDQELCEECANLNHEVLGEEYSRLASECELYAQFIASHKPEECQQAAKENELLGVELGKLKDEIAILEMELSKTDLENKQTALQIENQLIRGLHNKCCEENVFVFEPENSESDIRAEKAALDRITSRSVHADTFNIITKTRIASINGYSLGIHNQKTAQNNWYEINSAWGQVLPLLNGLSRYFKIEMPHCTLIPCAQYSHIIIVDSTDPFTNNPKTLPMYSNSFGKDDLFDEALLAVLSCTNQIEEEVRQRYSDFKLPHTIETTGIRDVQTKEFYSIKMIENTESSWTKVLHMFMTIIDGIMIKVD